MANNDNTRDAVRDDQVVPKTLLQKFWHASVPIIGVGDESKKAKANQAESDDDHAFHRKGPKSAKSRTKSLHSRGTRISKKSKDKKSTKSKKS